MSLIRSNSYGHSSRSPISARARIPSTYPFLQICNPFSLVVSSPLSHTLGPSTYFSVLMTGPCHIGVLVDRPAYLHLNEVYAPRSVGELDVSKCQSVRLHNARACECECYLFSRGRGVRSKDSFCPPHLLCRGTSAHDVVPDSKLVIYPSQVIYSSQGDKDDGGEDWRARTTDVKVKVAYPDFDLYPAVYPFVCPYLVPGELDNQKIKSVILCTECEQSGLHLAR